MFIQVKKSRAVRKVKAFFQTFQVLSMSALLIHEYLEEAVVSGWDSQ